MTEKTKGSNFKYVGLVGLALLGVVVVPFLVDASETKTKIDQAIVQPIQPVEMVQDTPDLVETVAADTEQQQLEPVLDVVEIAPTAGTEKPELESVDSDDTPETDDSNKVDYNTVLSFPITEEKMKTFVITADKIDQVNRKWDMLISGAETDTMAVEYITLSNEEMTDVMANISGITMDQYNEIFEYVARDPDFRNIVNAFKQYYVVLPRENKNQAPSSEISAN